MNLTSILLFFILGAITIVGYFLKDLPKLYRELMVEESRGKNEREIQKEAFFRQIKGTDIDKAFSYWTSLLVDMDNKVSKINTPKGQQEFIEMQQKVFMYGSKDTVVILSSMLQFVYKNGEVKTSKVSSSKQDGTNNSMYGYMLMFYIANLISSLKKDFTGYVINPKQILLIKIKDLDSHKNKLLFDRAEKNVQKELKKIGVTI